MTEHIIDLSEEGGRLNIDLERLAITQGEKEFFIPLAEVSVVIVSHPAVTLTQPVLSGLMKYGAVFITCDEKRMPIGMMYPLVGHHLQMEKLKYQIEASLPIRKRAWQQIIKSKIQAQGKLLLELHGDDKGLIPLAERVQSGDPDNVEGLASRKYWNFLFPAEFEFHRNPEAGGINALLNYGYAILRGITARAIVSAGLNPSIGIHHHNRYNPFCLADDLMEPYRPIVDFAVVKFMRGKDAFVELNKEAKQFLIQNLMKKYKMNDEERNLFDITFRTAVSLAQMFEGKRKTLILPEIV
ncbi:MAG: type II CRISPR-associated endonuclease Cas1 [Candidatus Hydrogenedens sp.]